MAEAWSWALAAGGITQLILTGRMIRAGWLVGLATSIGWAAYAVTTDSWGFLVSAGVFGGVHIRNWIAWGKKSK